MNKNNILTSATVDNTVPEENKQPEEYDELEIDEKKRSDRDANEFKLKALEAKIAYRQKSTGWIGKIFAGLNQPQLIAQLL